jgi:hypothetical protein
MGKVPPETIFYDETMRDLRDKSHKGWTAIFIPASMSDNQYLDVDYGAAFGGLSPELREAYANGNWDVVVGQAIHNLNPKRHMIRQFMPPAHWTKFMVIDWGMAAPFSVGWYCVSDGATLKGVDGEKEVYLPEGAVIRYYEWYGWNGKENQGCRLEPQKVAERIKEIENELDMGNMDYRVADSGMWSTAAGPSAIDYFFEAGINCQQSTKDRVANYNEILARLAGKPDFNYKGGEGDYPMLFVTKNCEHFWRTVPILQLDQTTPEKGPSEKEENHVYDEVAYACASCPYVTSKKARDIDEFQDQLKFAGLKNDIPYQRTNRQRSGRKKLWH